jgi:arginase
MTRFPAPAVPWTVLGVPIDSVAAPAGGDPFGTELAPTALRAHGLVERLGAVDRGDLDVRVVGPDRDPRSGIVGWPSLAGVTRTLRSTVRQVCADGARPLLLGGCCALLPGALAGARDALGPVGLAYADGHVDVYDHRTSPTGEAADMPVAALLGVGWPGWLETIEPLPVVEGRDVVVLGARDPQEAADVAGLPAALGLTVVGPDEIRRGPGATGTAAATRLRTTPGGWWLHLDLDVLDEDAFPATDYLMPGGLELSELRDLLGPLGRGDGVVGASVACYNPTKDPDGSCGRALAELLVDVLGPA